MPDTRFAISTNLNNVATTQYSNYDFNSLCVFNGVALGANSDGIFSLDTADNDNSVDIDAIVELPITDFGTINPKRFRRLYFGYESGGDLAVEVKVDEADTRRFLLEKTKTGQKERKRYVPMRHDQKGSYWSFRIENKDGCDFSIDKIGGDVKVLGAKR